MEKMKSFKAGTECTLKEPVFCPDNGETLRQPLLPRLLDKIPFYLFQVSRYEKPT